MKDDSQDENIEKDLAKLCAKELHGNAQPYAYRFIDKLPTTPAGKVDFRALDHAASGSKRSKF